MPPRFCNKQRKPFLSIENAPFSKGKSAFEASCLQVRDASYVPDQTDQTNFWNFASIDVGTGGHSGYVPPRFCNKQRKPFLSIENAPFSKGKSAFEASCLQVRDASYVPDQTDQTNFWNFHITCRLMPFRPLFPCVPWSRGTNNITLKLWAHFRPA